MRSIATIARHIQTKDIEWTDKYLSRTPFYSAYWIRKRIDHAIGVHAHVAHGTLLDVGCGIKPYERVFEPFVDNYIGLDFSPESGYRGNDADVCGDAARMPIADSSVDTILCTEVMVNLPEPERAITEFARVLRPGGVLIITAPFVYPVHDERDFFRFSGDGLAAMIKRRGMTVEKVVPLSGTALSLAVMFNLYWNDAGFLWTKWLYPIGVVFRPILWLMCFVVNVAGRVFETLLPDGRLSFGHLTVAKKELTTSK